MEENTIGLEQKLKEGDGVRDVATAITNEFNFRKHPIKATLKTLFVGAMGVAMCYTLQNADTKSYNRQLAQEVSILADANDDRATTSEEWANVYKELGVRYDAHNSNPFGDLTIEQKESYIRNHK